MIQIKRQVSGFSIMEIMIVVAIVGMMAVLIGPNLLKYMGRAKTSTTKSALAAIKSAMMDYYGDLGHFPTKAEGGVNALVKMPKGDVYKKRWQGPYIDGGEIPLDGWGKEFKFTAPPVKFKQFKHYEVYSTGEADDEENVPSDLVAGA